MARPPLSFRLLCFLLFATAVHAESGAAAWLRYAAPPDPPRYRDLPHTVVRLGSAPEEVSAAEELDRGLGHMIAGTDLQLNRFDPRLDAIVLGTTDALRRAHLEKEIGKQARGLFEKPLPREGFRILHLRNGIRHWWILQGGSPCGELYAAFRFMAFMAQDQQLPREFVDAPVVPIRWVDQWENSDVSVARGYAAPSIFFENGHARSDLHRAGDYARLLASVGINAISINHAGNDPDLFVAQNLEDYARIAEQLRPWGVRLALAVNVSSPQVVGGLSTADPFDPKVAAWWQSTVDAIYRAIPDLAGFTVNADMGSGALQTGRSQPDAVNVLARRLASHGGVLLYRASAEDDHRDVGYGHPDSARSTYDIFHELDGRFEPNVILQIKRGPIGFQVREPVSPLIASLRQTSQAMELQIFSRFISQQRQMVYLAPVWKQVLDTDMHIENTTSPVRDIIAGRRFHQPLGGMVGVANVGMEDNWLHHPMAMANLYSFGRLAWNPSLSAEQVLDEWTRMTWSNDARVYKPVESMNLRSWKAYEQYTGPLGFGTVNDIPGVHFAQGSASSEGSDWEQWTHTDHQGVGIDRTAATGSGYLGEYPRDLAAIYESLKTCPDSLLLFFHHVPYTHPLRGDSDPSNRGKTVIQQLYDAHYAGAAEAQNFIEEWESLQGLIDEQRYHEVHDLLVFQSHKAEVWRDAINEFFLKESDLPDKLGYVGHHPGRVEAEAMESTGFHPIAAIPEGMSSAGKATVCEKKQCSLKFRFQGEPNAYRVEVGYWDTFPGTAKFRLLVNGMQVAQWSADDPPTGYTATRFSRNGIRLKAGDLVSLVAEPSGDDHAAVDFIEVTRDPRWN